MAHGAMKTLQKSSFASICGTMKSSFISQPRLITASIQDRIFLFSSCPPLPPPASPFSPVKSLLSQSYCVLLNPIRRRGEFRSSFFREPRIHTKLADVPFSIPAALSLHTRNGKALCGCTAGCSELKPSGGTLQVLDSLLKVRMRK